MQLRRVFFLSLVLFIVTPPTVTAAGPAQVAAPCAPSITVLPVPKGASSGRVTAAVSNIAVGEVVTKNGVRQAARWRYVNKAWVLSPIGGLGQLPAGTITYVTGVNRYGAISLYETNPALGTARAFVAAGGVLYPLRDGSGGYQAAAFGISDSGRVVGAAMSSPERVGIPVRWDYWDQVPRGLGWGHPGFNNDALAIDNNDDIAGFGLGGPETGYKALRVDGDGTTQDLQLPLTDPLSYSMALDLNSSERTVGFAGIAGQKWAVIWNSGVPTVLPTFAGMQQYDAEASGVSENGTVVGSAYTDAPNTTRVTRVLFWTAAAGLQSLLPAIGNWAYAATANAVNEKGDVFGESVAPGYASMPTVWTCAARQAFTPTPSGANS